MFADIYTNTYGGGGVVASGVEETTGVGYGTGTGYGTAGGISGTGEAKGSVGGTIKEYREGGVNMAFLDNYFSEVMAWSFFVLYLWGCCYTILQKWDCGNTKL